MGAVKCSFPSLFSRGSDLVGKSGNQESVFLTSTKVVLLSVVFNTGFEK
jgi:hypothetical protein